MKSIQEQGTNAVNIIGKVLDVTFADGKMSDGRYYERCSMTVRVNDTMPDGSVEVNEIPVSMFAAQYTKKNTLNTSFDNLQRFKNVKTIQNVGEVEADIVRINRADLSENNFVARSGNLITTWQIRAPFVSIGKGSDTATFNIDVFIMDMHDEMDRDGEPTGRLVLKGGIVQYGGRLDVIEFIAESPDAINFIQRNWNVNDTVNIGGHIRYTSQEVARSAGGSSWGEDIPETTTRIVRELIITRGSDEPFEEEFAYDPDEIRKAFNVRKAAIEQLQVDAKQKSTPKSAAPTSGASKYSWE